METTELKITTSNIDLGLKKEDLVSIAVAKYRDEVNAEIAQNEAIIKDLRTKIKGEEDKARAELEKIVFGHFKPVIDGWIALYGKQPERLVLRAKDFPILSRNSISAAQARHIGVQVQWEDDSSLEISSPGTYTDDTVKAIVELSKNTIETCRELIKEEDRLNRRLSKLEHTDYNEYRDTVHAKLAQSVMSKLTGPDAELLRTALHMDQPLELPARPPQ